jgi:hypothetical protein
LKLYYPPLADLHKYHRLAEMQNFQSGISLEIKELGTGTVDAYIKA